MTCPECGATHADDQTCVDHFHLMGAWELDHGLYDVHHLMVLCYHLQHPSLYSRAGLVGAMKMLVAFLEDGLSPQAMRQRIRYMADSGRRDYKITGTPDAHGVYQQPVTWTMTARDVTQRGLEAYYDSVRAWADSVLAALRTSGNLKDRP